MLVSIHEFCRLCGIKRTSAFRLIREQEVVAVHLTRNTQITLQSIEALIDRRSSPPSSSDRSLSGITQTLPCQRGDKFAPGLERKAKEKNGHTNDKAAICSQCLCARDRQP